MQPPELEVQTIVSQPFQQNTFVAWRSGRSDCLVVDPGLEPRRIIERIEQWQRQPAALLITHGHSDHIGGNAALKAHWPECPIIVGVDDAPKLVDAELNLSAPFGLPMVSPPADRTVVEGEQINVAGVALEVLAIPGHSAGHVVYFCRESQPPIAFVGDVIFDGSIGRTDFPDGDFEQLIAGIREKLFRLPDTTRLYCGHGPTTTIGQQKANNPFLRG